MSVETESRPAGTDADMSVRPLRIDGGRKRGPMWKRLGLLGAVMALVALTVGVVTPALGSSGGDDNPQTIRVIFLPTEFAEIDLGDQGFSVGDEVLFSGNLLQDGAQVGRVGVICTFSSAENVEAQCPATATLPGGQITLQGLLVNRPLNFTLPITGGSGQYQGAEGQMVARDASSGTQVKLVLTFHLED